MSLADELRRAIDTRPTARLLAGAASHIERLEAIERAARMLPQCECSVVDGHCTSCARCQSVMRTPRRDEEPEKYALWQRHNDAINAVLRAVHGERDLPRISTTIEPAPATRWAIRANGHDKTEKRDFDTLRRTAEAINGVRGSVITYATREDAETQAADLRARFGDATFTIEAYEGDHIERQDAELGQTSRRIASLESEIVLWRSVVSELRENETRSGSQLLRLEAIERAAKTILDHGHLGGCAFFNYRYRYGDAPRPSEKCNCGHDELAAAFALTEPASRNEVHDARLGRVDCRCACGLVGHRPDADARTTPTEPAPAGEVRATNSAKVLALVKERLELLRTIEQHSPSHGLSCVRLDPDDDDLFDAPSWDCAGDCGFAAGSLMNQRLDAIDDELQAVLDPKRVCGCIEGNDMSIATCCARACPVHGDPSWGKSVELGPDLAAGLMCLAANPHLRRTFNALSPAQAVAMASHHSDEGLYGDEIAAWGADFERRGTSPAPPAADATRDGCPKCGAESKQVQFEDEGGSAWECPTHGEFAFRDREPIFRDDVCQQTVRAVEIRNLRRVPSKKHQPQDCSFTFEAKRGDEWIAYGPQVYGNWSVASYITREPFTPQPSVEDVNVETNETVRIGWQALADAWSATVMNKAARAKGVRRG